MAGYEKVIEQAESKPDGPDPDLLALVGWCYYRSGQHARAFQSLIQALIIYPKHVSAQFDLALIVLVSGNVEPALREYEKAKDMIRLKPVSRRVGLLRVALRDLRTARDEGQARDQWVQVGIDQAINRLETTHEEVEKTARDMLALSGSVCKSIAIAAPANFVYYHRAHVENYCKFMQRVQHVEWEGRTHLIWTLQGDVEPARSEVLEQIPFARLCCLNRSKRRFGYAVTVLPESNSAVVLRVSATALRTTATTRLPPDKIDWNTISGSSNVMSSRITRKRTSHIPGDDPPRTQVNTPWIQENDCILHRLAGRRIVGQARRWQTRRIW